jgi:probable HAF family extracellular repeat protein
MSGAVLLCLTVVTAQAGWRYQFSAAGNFPGATATVPLAVGLLHIVGEYQVPGGVHAYVQTGNLFVKAEPSGSLDSYLSGVNRHGVAVGGYCPKGCNPETGQSGYTFDSKTGRIQIIVFPMTGAATTAYGINDLGTIVGGYCPNNNVCPSGAFNPATDGFVDANGVFTTLNYPGANATSPFAVNNAGTIVGFYTINLTGPHAFLYQNSTFTTIDFPGSGYTLATSINNFGVVAGLFADSTGVHGFTYDKGTFTQVDKPGALSTGVSGINDHNELVGTWNTLTASETFKATPIKGPEQP